MDLKIPKEITFESFMEVINEEEKKHKGEIFQGIFRGTGYTLSSQTEDLFALYMKEKLGAARTASLGEVNPRTEPRP